jgi:CubicO group peptidase (beta-lactamase class C family)
MAIAALCATAGCAPPRTETVQTMPGPASQMRGRIDAILRDGKVTTAAIGVLRDGKLVFAHYYGDANGTPANAGTRFDVASVTKTVSAETFLRMAARGRADLDAPLHPYWIDPDIAADPRHRLLTPRMILSHRSGFPNWRFFRKDGKLAFERDPGSGYGYSGEGFNYLWRAMERKEGASYPALVDRYLFHPLGIHTARLTVDRADRDNVALARDDQGKRYDPGCRPGFCWPQGEWSAAGGLLITLEDYAKVMAAISGSTGYGGKWTRARDTIVTDRGAESVIDCAAMPAICPKAQGYGLGLVEVDLGQRRTIGHEGGDWSQLSIAYSYLPSRDGIVIFLNVPMEQGIAPMRDLIALLDPESPYLERYRKWAAEVAARRTKGPTGTP